MVYQSLSRRWRERYDDEIDKIRKGEKRGDHLYLENELYCNDRIRVDDHRLVYRFFPDQELLVIIGIGHKPNSYGMAKLVPIWDFLRSLRRKLFK